jgi:hypothetical protein
MFIGYEKVGNSGVCWTLFFKLLTSLDLLGTIYPLDLPNR